MKEDGYFKKGHDPRRNLAGRGTGKQSYPDALRRFLALTPKQLAAEAMKPLPSRDDITVLEAWALLDAFQGMKKGEIKHRSFGLDRTEGKPTQPIDLESRGMNLVQVIMPEKNQPEKEAPKKKQKRKRTTNKNRNNSIRPRAKRDKASN